MAFSPTSPVTGAAQTGFTSPTYTIVTDQAPDNNGKQYAVSAIGGTQTGVTVHSVSSPFTSTLVKPKVFKALGKPNPTTGLIGNVPRNVWKHITRHGVLPLAGQPQATMLVTTIIEVPAGADLADPANVRAALSLHYGIAAQQSAGIGDTTVTGTF
jgi:hypothetical protein